MSDKIDLALKKVLHVVKKDYDNGFSGKHVNVGFLFNFKKFDYGLTYNEIKQIINKLNELGFDCRLFHTLYTDYNGPYFCGSLGIYWNKICRKIIPNDLKTNISENYWKSDEIPYF